MEPESYLLPVVDVVRETADATSISFGVPGELAEQFRYTPGQFLTLGVPSERTGLVPRCYSLCSAPSAGGPLTVTVKRTVDGYASNWLNDNIAVGDTVRMQPPSGIFTPKDLDADVLLFAGGSGITPVMSIVREALAVGGGRIVLFYANRDERSVIFAEALRELVAANPERLQVWHWLESVQGLPTREQLRAFAAGYQDWDTYCCGPEPFMKAVADVLRGLGLPRARRHQEKFISLEGNPFGDVPELRAEPETEYDEGAADEAAGSGEEPPAGAVKVEVNLDGVDYIFDDWQRGQKLLDFLESKDVFAPYSCREGQCSTCAYMLLDGEVELLNNDILDDVDLDEGVRLGCQSIPISDTVKLDFNV